VMTTQDETPILDLHKRFGEAELAGDVAALGTLLDDQFVGVGPLGFTLTKEEWLERHASGDLKYQEISTDDISVRLFGDAAIIIAVSTQQATYKGNPVPSNKVRITQVAVNKDGQWVLAGTHIGPMGPPPGAPPAAG
jgi:ketosteroid isomerase-like protein